MSAKSDAMRPADSINNPQQSKNAEPRRLGLHQVYPHPGDNSIKTELDIVAIHGLDTHSPTTWVAWKNGDPALGVHWLKDDEMLPSVIKNARIFTYDWNANYDQDSSNDTLLGHADGLLESLFIQRSEKESNDPIIFIASCFGGLLLIKALHRAPEVREYKQMLTYTAGIVFLGTPFQGSDEAFFNATQLRIEVAVSMGGEASDKMVKYLKNSNNGKRELDELDELVQRFRQLVADEKFNFPMICFYETRRTDFKKVINKLSPGYVARLKGDESGILVPKYSASLQGLPLLPLDVRHGMLNKYDSPDDKNFKSVSLRIKMLADGAGKTLQKKGIVGFWESDAWILEHRYADDKLKIERLSGKELSMSQCYINLAIIEQPFQNVAPDREESGKIDTQSSPFSLTTRLKIETPDEKVQVKLAGLFDPRKRPNGNTIPPRRILIRGRAGVGKTTLCKKIVHDFIHCRTWRDLFDRILWVPLRNLKQKPKEGYTLEGLFIRDFFYDTPKREDLARELENALHNTEYARTLFVLDGLDEISKGLYPKNETYSFLEFLLRRPNVIVTCRPSVKLPNNFSFDLKLEAIGFYPDQITDYLEAVFQASQKIEHIQSFLRKHRLLQSLVRIPIQLDALCLIWEEESDVEINALESMTEIYIAIEQRLWGKDAQRLERLTQEEVETIGQIEMKHSIDPITKLLECLAFNGMYHNLVEFEPNYRDIVLQHVIPRDSKFTLNKLLEKVSFLRTSDPSVELAKRSYHFLHLTYQEFFAAKYFVRYWPSGDIEYCSEDLESQTKTSAYDFLQKFKYTARYDMVWRFAAGLLGNKVSDFFTAIEEEPLDLLGPVHQRLVMHCLSEADPSACPETRQYLESRLSQWVLFECDLTGHSILASESEFPHRALHNALEDSTRSQRLHIIRSLWYPGRHLSMKTITEFEKLLTNADAEVVCAAIEALKYQPDLPEQTVTCLMSLFESANENIWMSAAEVIQYLPNLSEKAVTTLVGLIRSEAVSKDVDTTIKALENSSTFPEETAATMKTLISNYYCGTGGHVQEAATEALGTRLELSGRMITILVTLVDFADNLTKRFATRILANQSNSSIQVATAFVSLIQGRLDDIENCTIALDALKRQTNLPEPIITSLVQLLENAHCITRESSAEILAGQSKLSPKAVMAIETLTGSSNASIQYTAAIALHQESNLPRQTIMGLLQLFKDHDCDLRKHASTALSKQSNLEHFIIDLVALLKDENRKTSKLAFKVLKTRSDLSEETSETLIELVENGGFRVRDYAARVLAKQSNLSTKAMEVLIVLLKSGEGNISTKAVAILGGQPRVPKGAATAPAGMLKDVTMETRIAITNALQAKRHLSQLNIELLTQKLEIGNPENFLAAIALGSQSNLPERTITALTTMLKSQDGFSRLAAASALEKQPNLSDKAIMTLVSLLNDSNPLNWENNAVKAIVPLLANIGEPLNSVTVGTSNVVAYLLRNQLPKEIILSIVALLGDGTHNVQFTLAQAIGTRSLIDTILNVLEVSSESKSLAEGQFSLRNNGNKRLRISPPDGLLPVPIYLGNLYGAFLCRSFREGFWLQVNPDDSSLTIHYPDGSRKVYFYVGSSDEVLNWRRRWNPKYYRL
ncbi:ARM repeat-containing protein [Xylaria scruposa]|nr:ARM repeat-containing protein [Xylaria scruposa]